MHPSIDEPFAAEVHRSLTSSGGRDADDPGVIAAVEALLHATYPLASIEVRAGTPAWDVYRDAAALDTELVRRVGTGDPAAAGRICDRHGDVAFAVALQATGGAAAAVDAVVASFQSVVLAGPPVAGLRVSFAAGARRASRRTVPAGDVPVGPDPLTPEQREVIELAVVHGMLGDDIARILDLDITDVRRLANAGLLAMARSGRVGGALA